MIERVHVLGASGSGTSTLGRAISEQWRHAHLDTDDFYWEPTEPPYQHSRPRAERARLLDAAMSEHPRWVVTGSMCGWGDGFIPCFELVVFLYVPAEVRLRRLEQRESVRYGPRIAPGGDLYQKHLDFMAWAALYDHTDADTRSRKKHEAWMSGLPCPVVRLEVELSVEERMARLEPWLGAP